MPQDRSSIFASYMAPSSTALMYALFADRFLGLQFVPEFVYQAQADTIATLRELVLLPKLLLLFSISFILYTFSALIIWSRGGQ
jgi:hypothetical protein